MGKRKQRKEGGAVERAVCSFSFCQGWQMLRGSIGEYRMLGRILNQEDEGTGGFITLLTIKYTFVTQAAQTLLTSTKGIPHTK